MSSDHQTDAAASAASPPAWRDRVAGEDVQHDPDIIRREPGLWGRLFGDDVYKHEGENTRSTFAGKLIEQRGTASGAADRRAL